MFTTKQTLEGKIDCYKVRLVAKGYNQTYGIEYDETFATVAKMNTVSTLVTCNKFPVVITSTGREECIPSQRFTRGSLYGDTSWVWYRVNNRQDMSAKGVSLWTYAVSSGLVR